MLAATVVALALCMSALWALSVKLENASIVDPFWGPGFLVAAVVAATSGVGSPRGWLMVALVAVWAVRLGLYLLIRNAGHGEDRRYAAMRAQHGARFRWVSLGTVFGFQGLLIVVLSAPIQAAIRSAAPLGVWDVLGLCFWVIGFAFEAVGDAQLTAFLRDPQNRGRVCSVGLWRYTRHPNYFGEATLWWGFGLLAVGAGAPWALFAPAIMTFLLLRVSGVSLLERDITERRPHYRDYIARTSAFFPMPPRR